MNKHKFLVKMLCSTIYLFFLVVLFSGCESEDDAGQGNPERGIIKRYITVDQAPNVIPALVTYNSRYNYLYESTYSQNRTIDDLDLDLDHILEVTDADGKKSYNIAIVKEFEYDNYYFENLHIAEKNGQFEMMILRYDASDDYRTFDARTFTGDVEIFDLEYNLEAIAQYEDGLQRCLKVFYADCFTFSSDEDGAYWYYKCSSGGGSAGVDNGVGPWNGSVPTNGSNNGGTSTNNGSNNTGSTNPIDPTTTQHQIPIAPNVPVLSPNCPFIMKVKLICQSLGIDGEETRTWLNAHQSITGGIYFYLFENGNSEAAQAIVAQSITLMMANSDLNFNQAMTLNVINNMSNGATGDPIELYLVAVYKNSQILNLSVFSSASNAIIVGEYTLTPHYRSNNVIAYYTAARYSNNTGAPIHGIEYIIKADALGKFQDKIGLYTAAANLTYLNGTPTNQQIAIAAGDYYTGLRDMWAESLANPMYYVYLCHVFVGMATNLNAVESSLTTVDDKIRFTSITNPSSTVNIRINNRSFTQYKQLISNKFPAGSWSPHATVEGMEIFTAGSMKYVGRSVNGSGYVYTIDYYRNDLFIGKIRFTY